MALNCAKLLALFDFEKILYENKGKTALVKKLITNTSAGQIENINLLLHFSCIQSMVLQTTKCQIKNTILTIFGDPLFMITKLSPTLTAIQ